ncbi:MAG: DUF47 domain-containing protein [Anderseniella sp.]
MSGGNSLLTRIVDRVLPKTPDFFSLVDDQCDMAVATLEELVVFMESGKKKVGKHVKQMEKEGDELKRRNIEALNTSFSTPMDREDIYRAIVDIDHLMNYAKTTVREMEVFGIEPDQHSLQMAIHLKEGTQSLQEGFKKLSENAILAEADALAARKAERTIEKQYRKALAELFDISTYVEDIRAKKTNSNQKLEAEIVAFEYVMEAFKRREVYRHMSNAADRLAHAGATLYDIVVKIA